VNQSSDGSIGYPENDVVAVVDAPEQVDQAISALRDAGVHAEDMQLLRGREIVDRIDASGSHCGFLKHIGWFMASVYGEGSAFARAYEAEGRAGHQLVLVHVHSADDVDRVKTILESNGGHNIKFFGHWVIRDLVA
jgi:hypothetical protein